MRKPLNEYDKSAVASAQSVLKQISTVYERQYSEEPPTETISHHAITDDVLRGMSDSNEMWASAAVLGETFTPQTNIYTWRWAKVEYERTKQAAICDNILAPIFEALDDPTAAQAIRAVSEHPFVGYQKLFTATMDNPFGRDCE